MEHEHSVPASSGASTPMTGGTADPPSAGYAIRLSRSKLLRTLAVVVVAILVAHLTVHIYHYLVRQVPDLLFNAVDVDQEENFSTWYQGFSLLFASVLLFVVAAHQRDGRQPLAGYWRGLGVVFVLLSMDEIAGYHETLNAVIQESWTVPAAFAVLAFVIVYARFLLKIQRATARRMVIAGAVYVGGALGMDKFSDWFVKLSSVSFRLPGGTLTIHHTVETMARTIDYSILTAIEEGMEMLGVWLFLRAILMFMSAEDEISIPLIVNRPAGAAGGGPARPS